MYRLLYSRYPEVEIVRSTKAASLIPRLDKIFSVHGLPHKVISDNGPPFNRAFNSTEFARYIDTLGIQFGPKTPKWPQGNAEIERFMQPQAIQGKQYRLPMRKIKSGNKNCAGFCYNIGQHFTLRPKSHLLNYYLTLLYAENSQFFILVKVINKHKQAQAIDKERREYNKQYGGRKRHTKPSTIDMGDTVLVRQQKQNKLTTQFNQTLYTVINRKGAE